MVFTRSGFFAFSIFRLAFVLVIVITIVIVAAPAVDITMTAVAVAVAAAAVVAPVVLAFAVVAIIIFPIDYFYLAFFSSIFLPLAPPTYKINYLVVFQTILPVNYLIKWNGCFKYWIKSRIQ